MADVPLISIRNLKTYFYPDEGIVKAVDGASFDIPRAKTIGIVSNVPGGLGVFEAVIASAMTGVSAVDLAVALIAYRCIFYLAPFLVAAAFVAVHVLRRASRRTSPRQPSHPSPGRGDT